MSAKTYNAACDSHDEDVQNSKRSLHRSRKEPALIEMQPEKSAEAVCNRQRDIKIVGKNLQVNQLAKSDACITSSA
jgi:hypothetical protein